MFRGKCHVTFPAGFNTTTRRREVRTDSPGISIRVAPFRRLISVPNRTIPKTEHVSLIRRAIGAIDAGLLEKVVVARTLTIRAPKGFDPMACYERIASRYTNAFAYCIHAYGLGVWLGASPEMLLRKRGTDCETHALAGTISRGMEDSVTGKERGEQQYVVRDLVDRLNDLGAEKVNAETAQLANAGPVIHIRTIVRFKTAAPIDRLLSALHPSAAIAGYPRRGALRFIAENEAIERKLYAGYVALSYPGGAADAFVILRCMEVVGNAITLYAGGGITSDSQPEGEWEETEMKMKTMRDVIDP